MMGPGAEVKPRMFASLFELTLAVSFGLLHRVLGQIIHLSEVFQG